MMTELPKQVPKMDLLDYQTLVKVAEMAAGMNKEEILATFTISPDDLSTDEEIYFTEFYNYGRGSAVNKVVQNLVDSTRGRQGQTAAMAFLKQFAKNFENVDANLGSGSFSFKFGTKE